MIDDHDYEQHADGDVFYDETPTARQMERLAGGDLQLAYRNITRTLESGPATLFALRGATLHNEHTIAFAVKSLAAFNIVTRRADGRYELAPMPAEPYVITWRPN